MAYQKGRDKHPASGRKKGTPNKRTNKVLELLKEQGYDPLVEAVKMLQAPYKTTAEIYNDYEAYAAKCEEDEREAISYRDYMAEVKESQLTGKDKLDGHIKLIKYIYPARKAIEVSTDDGKVAPVLNITLTPPKE